MSRVDSKVKGKVEEDLKMFLKCEKSKTNALEYCNI